MTMRIVSIADTETDSSKLISSSYHWKTFRYYAVSDLRLALYNTSRLSFLQVFNTYPATLTSLNLPWSPLTISFSHLYRGLQQVYCLAFTFLSCRCIATLEECHAASLQSL